MQPGRPSSVSQNCSSRGLCYLIALRVVAISRDCCWLDTHSWHGFHYKLLSKFPWEFYIFWRMNLPKCNCCIDLVYASCCSQENVKSYLEGVQEGWTPEEGSCSAESKEMLSCMTWVGRRSAKSFNTLVLQKLDRVC